MVAAIHEKSRQSPMAFLGGAAGGGARPEGFPTAAGAVGTATWHCRRRRRGGTMPDVQQPAAAFSVPLISLAFSIGRGPAQRANNRPAPRAGRGAPGATATGTASPEARMANSMSHLPPLPQIGHPESY